MTQPNIGAEGMMLLFDNYPDLLPPAVDVRRNGVHEAALLRAHEGMPCCHCGDESKAALVAYHQRAGYRWIDLCLECLLWVREALLRMKEKKQGA